MQIIPVILSGGSGVRLWPLSRKQYPKQYLPLVSDKTMLQETIMRLKGLDNLLDPIIVCNSDHRFLVAGQCQQIDITEPTILLEPIGRNTAPAIAAAALQSLKHKDKHEDEAVLLVLSADHVIQDIKAFHKTINIAINQACSGKLVTFGIVPSNANTDYGYIKSVKSNSNGAYKVEQFVEKPDLKTAESYLRQGNYLWNSGMFMFKAEILIDELTVHSPGIVKAVGDAVKNATQDLDFIRLDKHAFESSPSDSIDYALMEKSDNVVVVPLDAGWSDVGSWSSLWDISPKDNLGNSVNGDVILHKTTNSYVSTDSKLAVAIGLEGVIIVSTKDVVMVAHKDSVQDVKIVVEQIKAASRGEWDVQREVYRPWGKYDTVDSGEGYQVKRLTVNPGAKLSVQMHYHRSEHWVVVAGKARVHYGDDFQDLCVNESAYHGKEVVHALENLGDIPLELIEVQVGSYLGEDDIVRYEDHYGRVESK